MTEAPGVHLAFGLRLRGHFPLPELPAAPDDAVLDPFLAELGKRDPSSARKADVDLEVRLAAPEAVDAAFSGTTDPPAVAERFLGDGCRYRSERGRAGDYRIDYGERATFHLTADGSELRGAPRDPAEPSWRRFLLDTCLGMAALVHGFQALHAGGFVRAEGAVAVAAGLGGGKSTLLAEFVRRGRPLFSDDVLCLSPGAGPGRVVAHPGPPLMNLPSRLPDGTPAEALGRVLAVFGDESWVAVSAGSSGARPLAAVVVLERGDHRRVAVDRLPASPAALLPHSLGSGPAPEQLARRFALFADLARTVPLLRLRAPASLAATAVAGALDRAVDEALAGAGRRAG